MKDCFIEEGLAGYKRARHLTIHYTGKLKAQFDIYIQENSVQRHYAHIFQLLTRLRQATNHPYIVVCPQKAESDGRDQENEITIMRPSNVLNRIDIDNFQTSTIIEALRATMNERDRHAKGVVFSQFIEFLDLRNYSLQLSEVSYVQLDDSMSQAAQDAAIKCFNDDPDCRIFLMNLPAGHVALNLAVASHVFIMGPWWSPNLERQAQDIVHQIWSVRLETNLERQAQTIWGFFKVQSP